MCKTLGSQIFSRDKPVVTDSLIHKLGPNSFSRGKPVVTDILDALTRNTIILPGYDKMLLIHGTIILLAEQDLMLLIHCRNWKKQFLKKVHDQKLLFWRMYKLGPQFFFNNNHWLLIHGMYELVHRLFSKDKARC